MTGFAPGWYPDPDDTNARRYWDGQAWSAPLAAQHLSQTPSEPRDEQQEQLEATRAQFAKAAAQMGLQPTRDSGSATDSSALVCPHCQTRGRVTSRQVKQKKGISGGKLTGAVLTAGISMLGTGLSRKEKVTEMKCGKCKTTWTV